MSEWLFIPLGLFGLLLWGGIMLTICWFIIRALIWVAGGVITAIGLVLASIGFMIWWLFQPRAATEAYRDARRRLGLGLR